MRFKRYVVLSGVFLLFMVVSSFAITVQIGAFEKTSLDKIKKEFSRIIDDGYILKIYEKDSLKKVIVDLKDKTEFVNFKNKYKLKEAFIVDPGVLKKEGFKLATILGKTSDGLEKEKAKSINEATKKAAAKASMDRKKKKIPLSQVMNGLEGINIKSGSIYLYGRKPWEYVETEELKEPFRIIIHLFNTKNYSGVSELLFPLPSINKLRVIYDYKNKETKVVLYPSGEMTVEIQRVGRMVKLTPVEIKETKKLKKGKVEVYKGQKVSLEFKDADIRDVIRILAEVSGLNFVVDPKVRGTVTLRLRNVPWDKALDVILKVNKLGKIEEDGIIRIGPIEDINRELEARAKIAKSMEKAEPLFTEIFPLNYADINEAEKLIKPLLSDRGKVDKVVRLNALMVKDTKPRLKRIRDFLKKIDTPIPQVQISARLVEVTTDFTRELGIQWGFLWAQSKTEYSFPYSFGIGGGVSESPSAAQALDTMETNAGWSPKDITPGFVVDLPATAITGSGGAIAASLLNRAQTFGIDVRLSAMENEGLAKVISTPKVITMDNQEAEVSQGYEIPYATVSEAGTQTEFKEAKLKLKVRPHITAEGDVILDVEVSKDSPDFTHVTPDGVPIQTRKVKTRVRLKNGDTLVIGGIYEMNKYKNANGVPGLRRIPLLKWLFQTERKNVQKRELLIFITPTVIEPITGRKID